MTQEQIARKLEAIQKAVDEWKADKDKETRREVRTVWALISVLTAVIGFAIGQMV